MDIEIDGLDDLQDKLNDVQQNAEDLEDQDHATLGELFPPNFMREYTDFATLEEFFEESPWDVNSREDLNSIPDDEFDTYVKNNTKFANQDEMLGKAGTEFARRQVFG